MWNITPKPIFGVQPSGAEWWKIWGTCHICFRRGSRTGGLLAPVRMLSAGSSPFRGLFRTTALVVPYSVLLILLLKHPPQAGHDAGTCPGLKTGSWDGSCRQMVHQIESGSLLMDGLCAHTRHFQAETHRNHLWICWCDHSATSDCRNSTVLYRITEPNPKNNPDRDTQKMHTVHCRSVI